MLTNAWLAGLKAAAPPPAPGGVTWDAANKHANMLLSNGDLTATTTGDSFISVRSTAAKTTGKWKLEFSVTDWDSAYDIGVGFCTGAFDVTGWPDDPYVAELYCVGNSTVDESFAGGTEIYVGLGGNTGVIAAYVDEDSGKIWFEGPNGVYGGGDPVAGTGATYTFTPGTALYAVSVMFGHDNEHPCITTLTTGTYSKTGYVPWEP